MCTYALLVEELRGFCAARLEARHRRVHHELGIRGQRRRRRRRCGTGSSCRGRGDDDVPSEGAQPLAAARAAHAERTGWYLAGGGGVNTEVSGRARLLAKTRCPTRIASHYPGRAFAEQQTAEAGGYAHTQPFGEWWDLADPLILLCVFAHAAALKKSWTSAAPRCARAGRFCRQPPLARLRAKRPGVRG